MPKLKIDLHVHTNFSDSLSSLEQVLKAATQRQLDGIALTDHATVTTSFSTAELDTNLILLPGVEVETLDGHLLVLGLPTPPPNHLSAADTLHFARDAGGLTIIPHPGIPFISIRETLIRQCRPDALETHNAKTPFFNYFVEKNTRLADRLGLPKTGGSDAHSHQSVGDAYTIIDADSRRIDDIFEAIRTGRTHPHGHASNLLENIKTTTQVFWRNHHLNQSPRPSDPTGAERP